MHCVGLSGRNGTSVALSAFKRQSALDLVIHGKPGRVGRSTKASPASKREKRQIGKDYDVWSETGHEVPVILLKSRAMMRRNLLLLLVVLWVVPVSAIASTPMHIAHSATIYSDNYGVSHVFGPTDASSAFGYISAQA